MFPVFVSISNKTKKKSSYFNLVVPCISQIQKDGRRKRSFTERVFTTVLVGLRETNKDGEAKSNGARNSRKATTNQSWRRATRTQ